MKDKLLLHHINAELSDMTRAEKKVARVILSDYPTAGLLPVAKLAELSDVSAPTVLRFVKRLGFERYLEFQSSLLNELSKKKLSMAEWHEEKYAGLEGHNLICHIARSYQDNLAASLTKLPTAEFDLAIQILCNLKSRVTCTGGRFTDNLAKYLALRLHELRPDIRFSETVHGWRNQHAMDINNKDIIVVLDVRPYQKDTIEFARQADKNGAKIILITDPGLSPIASIANCVLPVEIEGPTFLDSTLNITALAELLIVGVSENLGEEAKQRIKKLQDMRLACEDHDIKILPSAQLR